MDGALDGLRVLDLTQGVAGPFGTKHLADYGADVIKIERPGTGDMARRLPPFHGDHPHPEKSGVFLYVNTNKRGVTLNLKAASGVGLFKELVRDADLVVESFRPGVVDRLGVGYAALSSMNASLVMVSVSDFGQTGPYRDFRLTEITGFALAGPMYQNGDPRREPLKLAEDAVLHYAGLSVANAAIGAAIMARMTGLGTHVDVSIAESFLSNAQRHTLNYYYTGEGPKRLGTTVRPQFLTGGYPCADGYVAVQGAGRGESWWPRVFRMMGQPELSQDPRFTDSRAIMRNRDAFDDLWYGWLLQHTRREVFDAAAEARFPLAPVYTTEDIYQDPHFNERGLFEEIDHPVAGRIRYPTRPFRLHGAPCRVRRPAPVLGQHNDVVYRGELGLSAAELAQLRRAEVV